jgi:peptidoglycan hydrolase CwlO-like protein
VRKKNQSLLCFIFILFLSGCNPFQSTPEKIHEILENVVEKELLFEEQQEPLVQLEKDEQRLYGEIMELGTKNIDEIVKKADEAIKIVEERKVHMQNEQESLKASEKEFKKVKPLIEKIDDNGVKEQADKLYAVMIERYSTHDELYSAYSKGLEQDKKLYNMLKAEERSLDELEAQIVKINEIYEKVIDHNGKFNDLTKDYNETKHEFYELSGLDMDEESAK